MSLIEVVLAMGILSVALIAVLQVVVVMSVNSSMNRHRVEAIQRADQVMIRMQALRDSGAAVPEEIVAGFPAGSYELPDPELKQEQISIAYENPAEAPLMVSVRVQWLELRDRPMEETLCFALEALQ